MFLVTASTKRRPIGLMAKASDFGSEDCAFESRVGRFTFLFFSPWILFVSYPVDLAWHLSHVSQNNKASSSTHSSGVSPVLFSPDLPSSFYLICHGCSTISLGCYKSRNTSAAKSVTGCECDPFPSCVLGIFDVRPETGPPFTFSVSTQGPANKHCRSLRDHSVPSN